MYLNLIHLVHLELDVAFGRDEDLRRPHVLSVGVVLDAGFAANELRAFALSILLYMPAARDAFVFVALLVLLLLDHRDRLAQRMVQLRRLQRVSSDDLNLPEVVAALGDEILSLDDALVLRDHRDGVAVGIILVVSSFMLVEER